MLVIASGTLSKILRGNVLVTLNAELHCVTAPRPRNIFARLVAVLNKELRPIGIGSDLGAAQFVPTQVGEIIQSGEAETTSARRNVVVSVKTKPQFIAKTGRKRMVFVDRDKMIVVRRILVEDGENRIVIDAVGAIVDIATADLILCRKVVVHAHNTGPVVGVGATGNGRCPHLDWSGVKT